MVSYLFTGLTEYLVDPGISRGACKLTRIPRVIKKKEKERCSRSKVYLNKKSNHIFSEKNKILNHHVSTGYMHRRNLVNYYQMADYKNLLINNCLPVHHSIHFINLLINYVK